MQHVQQGSRTGLLRKTCRKRIRPKPDIRDIIGRWGEGFAAAPGRLLWSTRSTRPTRRDGRCLLAWIFPFSLARQFGARSGKAPMLVDHPPIPAAPNEGAAHVPKAGVADQRRQDAGAQSASSERRPWMAVANVRRRDMGSPEPISSGSLLHQRCRPVY